jgi:hypothetical protein
LAQLDPLAHKDHKVMLVQLDHKDRKAFKVTLDQLDRQDQVVQQQIPQM